MSTTTEPHISARCAFIAALREAVPLGCYAVQERVREMIVEDESKQEGGAQEGGAQEGGEGVSGGGKEMYGEAKDQGKDSCDEAGGNGGPSEGWRRALTQREIEEVTLQGCLVPVRGVPNVGQVRGRLGCSRDLESTGQSPTSC